MKTFGCCHLLLLINPILSFGINSIRTLVTKHAFASYFMNEIVNEVADKPIILHNIISLSHSKFGVFNEAIDGVSSNSGINSGGTSFGLEFTTLSISIYVVYKFYYSSISSFYNKFHKLPEFKKYYRKFKFCIFVLIIVLTKEIENAI